MFLKAIESFQLKFETWIRKKALNENEKISDLDIFLEGSRPSVYWEAYWYRHKEFFEFDFPRVKSFLSEEVFDQVIKDFLKEFPSKFWSIYPVTQGFSDYLNKREDLLKDYPFLAELARLEYEQERVRLAPDDVFREVHWNLANGEDIKIILNSSLRVSEYRFAVHLKDPQEKKTWIGIWKNNYSFHSHEWTQWQAKMILCFQKNKSLVESILEVGGDPEHEIAEFFKVLGEKKLVQEMRVVK